MNNILMIMNYILLRINIWITMINIWLVIGSRIIDGKQGGTHFMAREGAGPVISVHHQDGDDGLKYCSQPNRHWYDDLKA